MPLWTDISVGAVYGAMKRLADEGLLIAAGQEREGNRPTRQIYKITEAGLLALSELRQKELREVWFKYDPFDLALTRCGEAEIAALEGILAQRLAELKTLLEQRRALIADGVPYMGVAEEWAVRHTEYRLVAEVDYMEKLLSAVPEIVEDAHRPRPRKEKLNRDV